jgi:hypothetical protein
MNFRSAALSEYQNISRRSDVPTLADTPHAESHSDLGQSFVLRAINFFISANFLVAGVVLWRLETLSASGLPN